MAKASLDALLVEIIQGVEKTSTDYRNFKSIRYINNVRKDKFLYKKIIVNKVLYKSFIKKIERIN